jgi:hypothetical protein
MSLLDQTDLQALLTEQAQENIRLEFKREDVGKEKTLKEISAFANTYGGYLIIGAEDKNHKLSSLPGTTPIPNYSQTITQWCTEGVTPPLQPYISNPIPSPSDPSKVCYVIYVEQSREAPHFLNSRKGLYVRTDEINQRFEPQLATYEEIQHLANRRSLSEGKRENLKRRSKSRFDQFTHLSEGSVIVEFFLSPFYPIIHLKNPLELRELLESQKIRIGIGWYPEERPINQFESVVFLEQFNEKGFIDVSTWGTIFYGFDIRGLSNSGEEGKSSIRVDDFTEEMLLRLKHACLIYQALGFNGLLQINLLLNNVKEKKLYTHSGSDSYLGDSAKFKFDDGIEFILESSSKGLIDNTDTVLENLLRQFLFAANVLKDKTWIEKRIDNAYKAFNWKRENI